MDRSGFLRFQLVTTTAQPLILKDSWIEIWTQLTLISSLYFEVLLIEQDQEKDENNHPTATLTGGASPCVAGKFKLALDTL